MFLLLAIVVDVRWLKNRHKILSKVYISPAYQRLAPAPSAQEGSGSPYALNDKLADVEVIGLDMVDGPEDVIFDRDDHMYTGSRHGDIHRFLAPDYIRHEIFAHIGGFRSAWRSTRTTTCWSASAAWACIACAPTAWWRR